MGLGLLLFPALGGYLFLLLWNRTRHGFLLWPGYHVVFRSAATGLLLFVVSFAVCVWLDLENAPLVQGLIDLTPMDPGLGNAVGAAALSVALGVGAPVLLNRFHPHEKASRRTAERFGRHREVFVHDSIRHRDPVEICTRSGKIYVALAHRIEMALPEDSDVAVIPLLSGYRDAGTRELRITTNYFPVLNQFREDGRLHDLRIAIPLSEIVSVRPFDLELYRAFSAREPGPPGLDAK